MAHIPFRALRCKILLNLTFLLIFSCQAYPQNVPDLIPFKKDGNWGYMDKNRKIIIQPKFQYAGLFNDGYAFVRIKNQAGTIDKKGNYIISPDHELGYEMPFSEGLIPAKDPKTGLTGYMDKKGQWQIKPQFNRGYLFSQGVTAVLIDDGKNWVFIDKKGKVLSKPRPFGRGSDFYFGMHVFRAPSKESPTGTGLGLLNRYGREVIPAKYFQIHIYNANLIHIMDKQKSGFVDSTGKEILAPIYNLESHETGYTALSLNKKTGVIDSTGKFVIPLKYDRLLLVGDGLGFVIDSVSNVLLSMEIYGHFINMKDEIIVPNARLFGSPERCKDGLCRVTNIDPNFSGNAPDLNISFSVVNLKGELISDRRYKFIDEYSEGLALVLDENDKAGFIDKTGKEVIKCQYEFKDRESYSDSPRFKQGVCLVTKNMKTFYIDKKGNDYTVK